jgi:predicted naringenin-chalcone synthase
MSINSFERPVYLQSIATAVPQHAYTQEFAHRFLANLPFYDEPTRRFLDRLYRDTGIRKRHTVIGDYGKDPSQFTFYPPSPDLRPEPGVEQRNELFIREADALSLRAAEKLLAGLPRLDRSRISHLVTVSCTGFSAPGFDFSLQKSLGLSPGLHRFHLGFMGCFAALPALKLAADICRSRPEAKVLVVALELCSVHLQLKPDREVMVANSLFADGAGTALVSAQRGEEEAPVFSLERFATRTIPESERDMAWRLGTVAFDMRLSAYVPRLIERNIGAILEDLLAEAGLSRADVALWAIHPGGRAILDRAAATLGLEKEDLWASYEVLRDYGNMSSATLLFVLELLLAGQAQGRTFAAAFGPGLTVESALLEKLP